MIESILESIKKPLGLAKEDTSFDDDVIMHINSVFSTLHSIGASPPVPIVIEDSTTKWSEYFGDIAQAQMVKSYMYLKVRLVFDPPATSFTIDAMKRQAEEWEWRLNLLEFDFDPESRPYNDDARRELRDLRIRMNELEMQVDGIDEEIIEVPKLSTYFDESTATE